MRLSETKRMLLKCATKNEQLAKYILSIYIVLITPLIVGIIEGIDSDLIFKNLKSSLNLSLVFAVLILISPVKAKNYIFKFLLILSAIFSIIEIGHILIFSSLPTQNVFFTIFETHEQETLEFIKTYVHGPDFFFLILIPLVWIIGIRKITWKPNKTITTVLIFTSALNISYNVKKGISFFVSGVLNRTPYKILVALDNYRTEIQSLNFTRQMPKDPVYVRKTKNYLEEGTVVVVIGESTSRNHMSLYGYNRWTNPELSTENDLWLFKNIVSPHSHTNSSLGKVLTFLNHEMTPKDDSPNIINLSKLAGFKTYWLSNQVPLGRWETKTTLVANSADKRIFLNTSRLASAHDEVLLKPFEQVLAEPEKRKVIFIHLMGTHAQYKERYPSAFEKFKGEVSGKKHLESKAHDIINAYDNAILYNDYIINNFLDLLKTSAGKNKTLVYFSDHGEEVYDFRNFAGHTESISSNFMFEIPFMIWTDPGHSMRDVYKNYYEERKNTLYSTEDFIHTLHDLIGIQSRDYIASRSILAEDFAETPRIVGSGKYNPHASLNLYSKKTRNDISFPKLMLHHTNRIEKMKAMGDFYHGFEVDMQYDPQGNFFDVYHPPKQSSGLSFETFLKEAPPQKYFWMDFKNLDANNKLSVLKLLNKYDIKYKIKDRIIFESRDSTSLEFIAKAGYKTSWYLPMYSGKDKYDEITYLNRILPYLAPEFSAVSRGHKMIPFLKKHLKNVDFLTWGVGPLKNDKEKVKIDRLISDPQIKIILVKEKTEWDQL